MNITLFEQYEVKQKKEKKDVSLKAESYTGVYGMHKYWGKKPYNIMAAFIERYTAKGELVLDPFCGSGVSVSEAVFNNRKGLGVDINPSSILITDNVIKSISSKEVLNQFSKIEKSCKSKILSLYEVVRNNQVFTGEHFLWENDVLSEVRYTKGTKTRVTDSPTSHDNDKATKINYESINLFYPKENFFHNSRINADGNKKIYELFTPRNLFALALIKKEIDGIGNSSLREFFEFCFTASLGQASKMVFVIKRRSGKSGGHAIALEKKEVGSWVIGYWAPKEYFENNVWTCFENRFRKILKAKKIQDQNIHARQQAKTFEDLENKDYLLINQPSQLYLKSLPDNSIDYILTDPPHGNRIPYLELSLLWNSWMQKTVNYEDEIIVSESKIREKDGTNYNQLMYEVFVQCHRILKPEKKLSFMFNSLDDDAWIHSVEMFYKIGFELLQVETLSYSANSVVQDNRRNGLQTDFIITYKKRIDSRNKVTLSIINLSEHKAMIDKIASMKADQYKPFEVINYVFSELLRKNQFVKISELLKEITNA